MIENRTVYIEFLSRDCVRIVTPFRDKTFDLTKDDDMDYINLITLEKTGSERRSGQFRAFIDYTNDSGVVEVELDVQVKVSDYNNNSQIRKQSQDSIGLVRFDDSPKTFKVKYESE
jgi:hypothetical protein